MHTYGIRKNWIESFDLIRKNRIVMMPFIITAFLEALTLEIVYFSTRNPIAVVANPIIRKFFGEGYLHYPGHLILISQAFYYLQMAIYAFFGVFLTAISVNIFKNIKEGLPVKAKAMVNNALKHYSSFFIYAVIVIALLFLLRRLDMFVFAKIARLLARYAFQIPQRSYHLCLASVLFLTNVIMQAFIILTVPIIVIHKKSFLKAFARSIYLGARNFLTILGLIILPFLAYLPVMLLKSFSAELADKTFPEEVSWS